MSSTDKSNQDIQSTYRSNKERQDTATTQDSDIYLKSEGLGTSEKPLPAGQLASTATINELLKAIASANNVSSEELITFLESAPKFWGGETYAILLARKLYTLHQAEKNLEKSLEENRKGLASKIKESKYELWSDIEDLQNKEEEIKKELAELKTFILGSLPKDTIHQSLLDEVLATRAYLSPLISLPTEMEKLRSKVDQASIEEISATTGEELEEIQHRLAELDILKEEVNTLESFKTSLEALRSKVANIESSSTAEKSINEKLVLAASQISALNCRVSSLEEVVPERRFNIVEQKIAFLQTELGKIKSASKEPLPQTPSNKQPQWGKWLGIFCIIVLLLIVFFSPKGDSSSSYYAKRDSITLPVSLDDKLVWYKAQKLYEDRMLYRFKFDADNVSKTEISQARSTIKNYLCSNDETHDMLKVGIKLECSLEDGLLRKLKDFVVTKKSCL